MRTEIQHPIPREFRFRIQHLVVFGVRGSTGAWQRAVMMDRSLAPVGQGHLLMLLMAESSPFPCRDLLRIGVTLAGHQKKILSSIQDMRLQMNQTLPVQV